MLYEVITDQRVFEAGLPVNTVAFAAGQASINESDPAVQIDIVRFNPDDSSIVIGFTVDDITASEGEDYFAPGNYSISFGPGQRSARILIPLVQDSLSEGDEAFVVELRITSYNVCYTKLLRGRLAACNRIVGEHDVHEMIKIDARLESVVPVPDVEAVAAR